MKRYICFMIALVLAVALAGCGSDPVLPDRPDSTDGLPTGKSSDEMVYDLPSEGLEDLTNSYTSSIDFTAQCIRTNGYVEGEEYPKSMWITSPSELMDYYNANREKYDLDTRGTPGTTETLGFLDVLDSYDEHFFEGQDLILVVLEEPSGSIRHHVREVKLELSNLNRIQFFVQPVIERTVPEVGTDDMAEWHILIAVSKDYGYFYSDLLDPMIE